ncbi:histidine phosphatase family protein [Aurantimonas sp. VKM B-3413]|uniref:SixA phosphatase family protein n=1 Tax=Aurantimonas sp. VKM B-3413 TaxID=2779401 RepID=UPI001E5750E7|nr:histidine phosphatase family protein [Aurantimonas sp. VKM B-3413]MCB8837226.1 histidine phosphatase family protein [Aurantimonas sp. VKM B-3413]
MTGSSKTSLLILRHAHSSWASPGQRDHQRPLDERGRREAELLCRLLQDAEIGIDAVICSTAVRAIETLEAIRPALPAGLFEELSNDLYALGTEAYYAAAKRHSGRNAVLLVGHNPMVEDFARSLVADGEREALKAIAEGFPTSAFATIAFDRPLGEIAPKTGFLAGVIIPREER